MFYYWWSRYQTLGWEGLKEKPTGRQLRGEPKLEDLLKENIAKLRKRFE